MHTFRQPALLALCLVLSACGAAPTTVMAPEPPGGGGGATVPEAIEPDASTDAAAESTPQALESNAAPVEQPTTAPTPSASVTPPATSSGGSGSSGGSSGSGGSATTPTPTPTASATATPAPSATTSPTVTTRTLTVLGDRHLVTLTRFQSFGTSPFQVISVEANAFAKPGQKFPALAGASRGRYGWKYARITPETAKDWSGDIGGPGECFFLDSVGGEADNSGSWVVQERYDDGTQVHEIRTEIAANKDVNTFDPAQVAFANLGDTAATWTVQGAWVGAQNAPTSYPAGCFVVYTRPDGTRDFAVLGPGTSTLEAKGYVYAFFVTNTSEKPDGDLKLTLTRP
jgi:hypothetical protein